MKKVALLLSVLLVTTCGGSETSKPTALTGGLFVNTGSDSQAATALNLNNQSSDPVIDLSKGGVVLLTFSNLLRGDSVELINRNPTTQAVSGFSPVSGIVSVKVAGSSYTGHTVQYRPDGGYVPPPDTAADNFPKPAIAVQLPAGVATSGQQIVVTLKDQAVVGADGVSVGTGFVSLKAK